MSDRSPQPRWWLGDARAHYGLESGSDIIWRAASSRSLLLDKRAAFVQHLAVVAFRIEAGRGPGRPYETKHLAALLSMPPQRGYRVLRGRAAMTLADAEDMSRVIGKPLLSLAGWLVTEMPMHLEQKRWHVDPHFPEHPADFVWVREGSAG